MLSAPGWPTVKGMQTSTPKQSQASGLPARTVCTFCEHTEFVHVDSETRKCLYTECDCVRFTPAVIE